MEILAGVPDDEQQDRRRQHRPRVADRPCLKSQPHIKRGPRSRPSIEARHDQRIGRKRIDVRVAFSCFLPGRVVGELVGGKVRRGGSSAAAVAEGGPCSDDSSRYERPANYAPNGEQIDAASRHEPGIIRGKGAVFPSSPTQGSQERRGPFPGLSCEFVCDVPGSSEVSPQGEDLHRTI